MRPHLVALAGGTASGKTTLARQLVALAGVDTVAVVELDGYYRCQRHRQLSDRVTQNYDHPDAFEFDLLVRHLHQLQSGQTIDMPIYDFALHTRKTDISTAVEPRPVILVEGFLSMCSPEIREVCDTRIFVDAPETLRFTRRAERDVRERGRTVESVRLQWDATVHPMHTAYCEPTRAFADRIVDGAALDDTAYREIWEYVAKRAGYIKKLC